MASNKRAKRARVGSNIQAIFNNVEADFRCRWGDCKETIEDLAKFYTHLRRHLWTGLDYANNEQAICRWRECLSNAPWTLTHVLYHGYHEKLKIAGDAKLEARSKEGYVCYYSSERKHTVDIFDSFDCEWTDCDYVLDGPDDFDFHLLIHVHDSVGDKDPNGSSFKCLWSRCDRQSSYTVLKNHVKSHSSHKDAACSHCGSIFRSGNKFFDHFRRQREVSQSSSECRYCAKKFANDRLLRDHERGHISHFKCPLCDMTMPSPNDVKSHIATRHSSERPYACKQCSSRFKLPRNLSTHIERVHLNVDMQCPDCTLVTKSHYQMRKHRLTEHDGSQRVYACHLCPAKFDIEGHLLSRHLVSEHELQWPSGHRRFHYVRDRDGLFRLQTFRYESADIVELVPSGVQLNPVVACGNEDEEDQEYEDDIDGAVTPVDGERSANTTPPATSAGTAPS
ncbi:histone H4 transcription factor [Galendromus occidentalis]|uniref:Histone H4 transcription factor n=1 Tax=Galendromus occidentalis TaxID=34638 RepID=A0AAJ7L4Y2_9ACAR|nr:histone H4 transcription factor [Galendromus occidentalis]